MSIRERLVDLTGDDELLFLKGFDDCVLGVADRIGIGEVVAYDKELILMKLISEGLSYEEALEHFENTVIGGYVGEKTPIFVTIVPSCLKKKKK